MKYGFTGEMKKYNGITLNRIIALKDFSGIKKDDLGGWIEKESNLSHSGNAWVYGEAMVFDHAKVYDHGKIYDSAKVYDHGKIYDSARVFDSAKVYDSARVFDSAKVYDSVKVFDFAKVHSYAKVYGNTIVFNSAKVHSYAKVYGNARVYDDAIATKEVINITGLKYNITITDNYMCIGCENHPIDYWLSLTKKDIIKMDGKDSFAFYKIWNKPLRKLIKNR